MWSLCTGRWNIFILCTLLETFGYSYTFRRNCERLEVPARMISSPNSQKTVSLLIPAEAITFSSFAPLIFRGTYFRLSYQSYTNTSMVTPHLVKPQKQLCCCCVSAGFFSCLSVPACAFWLIYFHRVNLFDCDAAVNIFACVSGRENCF